MKNQFKTEQVTKKMPLISMIEKQHFTKLVYMQQVLKQIRIVLNSSEMQTQ